MKATERLYLTLDRSRVVREGDPTAATLWRTPGKDISAAEAKQYGLKDESPKESKAVNAPPENKAVGEPAEEKAEVEETATPEPQPRRRNARQ